MLMMRLGKARYERARQDLHVAREDDEVDPEVVEERELLRLPLALVLLRDVERAEGHVEPPGHRLEVAMVADDHRHLDPPLARPAAREDVVQARGVLRREDGHSLDLVGEVEAPGDVGSLADQSAESVCHLFVRQRELREAPLQPRQVLTAAGIHVLVVVEDAAAVGVDELGESRADPQAQGTLQEQDRRALRLGRRVF